MRFEWDSQKNEYNKIKHGISFEEAQTVFDDRHAFFLNDDGHSFTEERFIIIGLDKIFRMLTVCYCERGEDKESIRIISARRATKQESNLYEEGLR